MSFPVQVKNQFIPHCTIPADLHPKVMVEVTKVINQSENYRSHAFWVGNHSCRLIAKNYREFELGADSAYNLGALWQDISIGAGTYVFVSVGHDGDRYYAWVKRGTDELVAIHRSDCDLMQEVVSIADKTAWLDYGKKKEQWFKQGKTLFYTLEVCIRPNNAAFGEHLRTMASALDVEAMLSREIADRLTDRVRAWCVRAESVAVEPNYKMLPQHVHAAALRVEVASQYWSMRVRPEVAFREVKLPQYIAAGIDVDLAEILEEL